MAGQLDAHPFREQGFCVVRQEPDSMKVVRGRCEVHIRIVKDGAVLEIPVMKFPGQKGASEALMSHLLERNGTMDGPGFSGSGTIAYITGRLPEGLRASEKLALKMQQTVEKLGPKVLNVAQQ